MSEEHYVIRVPGLYNGKNLDRGQYIRDPANVFINIKGENVIGLLLRMQYIVKSPKILSQNSPVLFRCDNCGAEFVKEYLRVLHKQKPSCVTRMEPRKEDIARALEIDIDKLKIEDMGDITPPRERITF